MGMIKEQEILTQSKKGQGETNTRLDELIKQQQATNKLLERILAALTTRT